VADLRRACAAEALGTCLLAAGIVGSGIMAERLTHDIALALLCNTAATASLLVVLILSLAPVSGAHFNPAVTLSFLLRRECDIRTGALYMVAQFAGGIAGTWLAHAMFALPVIAAGTAIRTGAAIWLSEFVASFGLLLTIFATRGERIVAFAVGLYIAAAYWFTASTSFANPAIAVARALTPTFSGIRPLDLPGFVIAEILGALAATLVSAWLFGMQGKAARG